MQAEAIIAPAPVAAAAAAAAAATVPQDSGLELLPLPTRGLLSFQVSRQSAGALSALRSALGFEPPSRPNSATSLHDVHCLWISPRHWLIDSEPAAEERLFAGLAAQARAMEGTARVTRSSDCFDSVLLSGAQAASLLARGCALDLRDVAAPPNTALRTRFADVPIILYKLRAATFRLHVDVSLSHHLWLWLADARESFDSEHGR
ncbi:MAG TPA: sarcosine oxidase subunit gamma family protein [Steroidobacteraceae bacterium]|nr:sarcosine oxidase subunit gamma family protein [Steroidobacteraceae bacterium]